MSNRIYQPDRKSKVYFYVFIFSATVLGFGFYIYSRPLTIDSECSEMAQKTTGLTKNFEYDPFGDYDYQKAKCLEEVLSAEK